jgi:hypothetical protein
VVASAVRSALGSDWFDRVARFGYAAKGVVFGGVGILALRHSTREGADADVPGLIENLAESPFTIAFLVLLILGFLAYAAWRYLQCFADVEEEGRGALGLAKRTVYFGIGATYSAFAVWAIAALAGVRSEEGELQDHTATVLGFPGGEWLVGIIGLGVVAGGLNELWFGLSLRYRKEYQGRRMHPAERVAAAVAGWFGHVVRGAVYCLVGWFALRTAWDHDPDEVRGLSETFSEIAAHPGGEWGVILASAGFIGFGLYCIALAFHREMPNERASHGGLEES